jgi:oligoendopeptidase F
MSAVTAIQQNRNGFIPKHFQLNTWEELQPFFDELLHRHIQSLPELEQWIMDKNQLDMALGEAMSWRYINITVDSTDTEAANAYNYAVEHLAPNISSYEFRLDQKLIESPWLHLLDHDRFFIYLRSTKNAVQLFREANIPLATDIQLKSKEYVKIFSEMTIGYNGQQMTLQKATALLEETDREARELIYHQIHQRILQDKDSFEDLFDALLQKRHQMALNAGFDNFRDYKFNALGRFDYSVADCLHFHDAIEQEILPIVNNLNSHRKKMLGLEQLRPWDLFVDPSGDKPLRPFQAIPELVSKVIRCLSELHPSFGVYLAKMNELGHLDLDSRPGKRPGGYNMPLMATGVPFIFMNATNSFSDLRTFMHESGHAVHSFLTRHYPLKTAKRVPSEVAELAAMTMELLSMEHWDIFFPNPEELRRAKIAQLEFVLKVLPWIATIDKFQHWIYQHPHHTPNERKQAWMQILRQFSSDEVERTDMEGYSEYLWHKQLHIFEVPFYYIEYGMAQLGAIAIWKQYRENPEQTIANFISALKLGYTRPIGEIYQAAGIPFDFSRENVKALGDFVREELNLLIP